VNIKEFIEFTDEELKAESRRLIVKLPSYTSPPSREVIEDLKRQYKVQKAVWIRSGQKGSFTPFMPLVIGTSTPKDHGYTDS
jgi:hypothetical protein